MRIPTPISEKEADSSGFTPWKPGDYDFEVKEASEETSSTGSDMIKLTLWVFNDEGNKRTVFDYLLGNEKSQWKVRHAADAMGLIADYERGELDVNDIVGKTGRLKLRIKPAQGDYPANNQVGDYIPRGDLPEKIARPAAARPEASRPAAPARQTRAESILNDDIPF